MKILKILKIKKVNHELEIKLLFFLGSPYKNRGSNPQTSSNGDHYDVVPIGIGQHHGKIENTSGDKHDARY